MTTAGEELRARAAATALDRAHPIVSVVIPTYNRPRELERVLLSVRDQTLTDFECLVVDDGSPAEARARYDEIWRGLDDRFHLHVREAGDRVGGPGKSRNTGVRHARGTFVAFCDDDDRWIRSDHLAVAVHALTAHRADLFFANMQSATDGTVLVSDWLAAAPGLSARPIAGESDLFDVSIAQLDAFLAHRNLHADMLVLDKDLFIRAGMYSEDQLFGEDYDIQLRLADKAKRMVCRSTVTAELEVSPHASISRNYDSQNQALLTILSCLRGEISVHHPVLRRRARAYRAWYMLQIGRRAMQQGDLKQAREIAVQALSLHPSWAALRLLIGSIGRRS